MEILVTLLNCPGNKKLFLSFQVTFKNTWFFKKLNVTCESTVLQNLKTYAVEQLPT